MKPDTAKTVGEVYARKDRHVFVVCCGEHCREAGSDELLDVLRSQCDHLNCELRVAATRECIGHCAAAPAMVEDGRILRWVSPRRLKSEMLRLGIRS